MVTAVGYWQLLVKYLFNWSFALTVEQIRLNWMVRYFVDYDLHEVTMSAATLQRLAAWSAKAGSDLSLFSGAMRRLSPHGPVSQKKDKPAKYRHVFISDYLYQQRQALDYQLTDDFDQDMKARAGIERIIAGLVRYNGARPKRRSGRAIRCPDLEALRRESGGYCFAICIIMPTQLQSGQTVAANILYLRLRDQRNATSLYHRWVGHGSLHGHTFVGAATNRIYGKAEL